LGELGHVARAIVRKRIHDACPGRIGCGGREIKNRGISIAGFTGFTTGCSKNDDKYRGAQEDPFHVIAFLAFLVINYC